MSDYAFKFENYQREPAPRGPRSFALGLLFEQQIVFLGFFLYERLHRQIERGEISIVQCWNQTFKPTNEAEYSAEELWRMEEDV